MRGRTYLFNVTQMAAAVEKSTGSKLSAADVAGRAADIVDATFAEMKSRNAADAAKAVAADIGDPEQVAPASYSEEPEPLHTAEDVLKADGLGDDGS